MLHAFPNPLFEAGYFPVILHGKDRIDEPEAQPAWPILHDSIVGNLRGSVDRCSHEGFSFSLSTTIGNGAHHFCHLISSPAIPDDRIFIRCALPCGFAEIFEADGISRIIHGDTRFEKADVVQMDPCEIGIVFQQFLTDVCHMISHLREARIEGDIVGRLQGVSRTCFGMKKPVRMLDPVLWRSRCRGRRVTSPAWDRIDPGMNL